MICIAFKIKQKQNGVLSEQNAVLAKEIAVLFF